MQVSHSPATVSASFDEPPLVAVSPPRRKRKDLAEQDIQRGQEYMQEFLDGYDEMVQNLASMKVTAEQIMKRNGWGPTAV